MNMHTDPTGCFCPADDHKPSCMHHPGFGRVTPGLRIVAAAFRTPEGMVLSLPRPARHYHILTWIREQITDGKLVGKDWYHIEQGFLDSGGRFRTREESMQIAIDAGQVIKGSTYQHNQLFSEDVW